MWSIYAFNTPQIPHVHTGMHLLQGNLHITEFPEVASAVRTRLINGDSNLSQHGDSSTELYGPIPNPGFIKDLTKRINANGRCSK